jgi:hypothetical protein
MLQNMLKPEEKTEVKDLFESVNGRIKQALTTI